MGREEGTGEKRQIQFPSRLHKPSQLPGKERLESLSNQFHNSSTRLSKYKPVPDETGVAQNFIMFNAGLFGNDVDYGEECENIDKKRCRAPSRQSEQTTSWARYMEMRSTRLNSLMETK